MLEIGNRVPFGTPADSHPAVHVKTITRKEKDPETSNFNPRVDV
jgi:hypothetical protein